MATSTANTILKSASSSAGPFTKLLDITDYPDLGGSPSTLDTTDLTATRIKTSILGLQDVPDLTFEANYDLATYTTISAMTGVQFFNLELGAEGVDGIFAWSGNITVFKNGGGVDEVRKMTVVVSAETEIKLKA